MLSHAEEVFVSATSLASEQAWDEWRQLRPAARIAESELRNDAAKQIEYSTSSVPAKHIDDANLSIALTRWNEMVARPAPDIRTARVSENAADVQHLPTNTELMKPIPGRLPQKRLLSTEADTPAGILSLLADARWDINETAVAEVFTK